MIGVCREHVPTSRSTTLPSYGHGRYGLRTKTEAVDLALRCLAGQPMRRDEALAMRGAHAIVEVPLMSDPGHGMILVDTSAWVEYDRATASAVDLV